MRVQGGALVSAAGRRDDEGDEGVDEGGATCEEEGEDEAVMSDAREHGRLNRWH